MSDRSSALDSSSGSDSNSGSDSQSHLHAGSDSVSLREILGVFRRAVRYARPYRRRFAIKTVLTILALAPALFVRFPVKIVIDHVILGTPLSELFAVDWASTLLAPLEGLSPQEVLYWMIALQLGFVFLLGISGSDRDVISGELANGQDDATRSENEANHAGSYAGGLFGLYDYRFMLRLTQDLNHHYRSKLFERIQTLPASLLDNARIGDAVYRVMYDTPSITNLVYKVLVTPFVSPFQILVAVVGLVALFPTQRELLWLALSFLPLTFAVAFPFSGLLRRRGLRSRRIASATTATIEESTANVLAVQSLGAESRERDRFDADSWKAFAGFRALYLAQIATIGAIVIAGGLLGLRAFVVITDGVVAGTLSPGDFALILTLYAQILLSCASLGALWVDLQKSAPGLTRVFQLMDLPREEDSDTARDIPRIRSGFELRGVCFDYPDGTSALRDVDLDVRVGRVTALCGAAGAGKTTLAQLLPRFLIPTRGQVSVDGVSLAQVRLASLRDQIGFVFQEHLLLRGTIEENIRLGRPDATDLEVRRAAQRAGADEFIARLPNGYRTELGRDGGTLSVGQKQRLSVARALVREASVLILDEPTSALDPATEQRLVESLRDVKRESAVLVIAHRLSTIRHADQIAFMDQGRIVELGTHQELLERGGAYARFVALQAQGAA